MMADRAADFRLDAKLKKLCVDDIADLCARERDTLDQVAGYDARVIQCLQDFRSVCLSLLKSTWASWLHIFRQRVLQQLFFSFSHTSTRSQDIDSFSGSQL